MGKRLPVDHSSRFGFRNDSMIGGSGLIVQVDESKFKKRKAHRRNRVGGV